MAGKSKKADVKPRLRDYARAVRSMVRTWVRNNKRKSVSVLMGVILIVGGAALWARPDKAGMSNDAIVIRVSRELGISGDGNPAFLEVNDESKVSQPFLEGARNGDKVLLYYKAGKSVLYRPGEDRIIRSGTYRAPDAKVFVRQGGTNDAAPENVMQRLKEMTGVEVVSKDYSTNRLNEKTVVIDITDRYNEKAQEIARELGVSVARLPRGESVPDADIMVLVGNQ